MNRCNKQMYGLKWIVNVEFNIQIKTKPKFLSRFYIYYWNEYSKFMMKGLMIGKRTEINVGGF